MSIHDDFPYRPKARSRRVRSGQDSSFRLAVLSKMRGFTRVARGAGRARIAVRPPTAFSRRVVIKARYVQSVQGDLTQSARLHLAYVEREGVERDGTPGRLYSAEEPERDRAVQPGDAQTELHASILAPIEGEKHQFRMIVAPEDGRELDLTAYTREFMVRVEGDMKQRLIWAAVNHYDTDQPHVHLIIRGVDRDGAEVRFQRAYLQRGLRHRAQDLATATLGPRTELDHERQLAREVKQGRFTSLDRRIERCAQESCVRVSELGPFERARLEVLERMELAMRVDTERWRLVDGWEKQLKSDGERGDIIKQIHRALPMETRRYQVIDRFAQLPEVPTEKPAAIHGRVVDKGLSDQSPNAMYIVVETARGNGYFVPLWRSEQNEVRVGDLVSLSQLADSRIKPLDAHIEALAKRAGGDIALEDVLAAIELRLTKLVDVGIASGDAQGGWKLPTDWRMAVDERAAELVPAQGTDHAAHDSGLDEIIERAASTQRGTLVHGALLDSTRKRLRELEEQGLAERATGDPGERWKVPADLMKQLAELDQASPKYHVSMRREALRLQTQITYEGPTWLDKVQPHGDVRDGFAAELRNAKGQRFVFLRERGITNLRARERAVVAAENARALGLKPADKVEGFVGRLERIHRCPNGNLYAIVVSKEAVAAVPTGRSKAKLVGRSVRLEFVQSEYTKQRKLAILAAEDLQPQRARGGSDKGRALK